MLHYSDCTAVFCELIVFSVQCACSVWYLYLFSQWYAVSGCTMQCSSPLHLKVIWGRPEGPVYEKCLQWTLQPAVCIVCGFGMYQRWFWYVSEVGAVCWYCGMQCGFECVKVTLHATHCSVYCVWFCIRGGLVERPRTRRRKRRWLGLRPDFTHFVAHTRPDPI